MTLYQAKKRYSSAARERKARRRTRKTATIQEVSTDPFMTHVVHRHQNQRPAAETRQEDLDKCIGANDIPDAGGHRKELDRPNSPRGDE